MIDRAFSTSPNGDRYALPDAAESSRQDDDVSLWLQRTRRPVIAVQGIGFVGAAMAVALSMIRTESGQPKYSVVGVDLPTPGAFWRIAKARDGEFPMEITDTALREQHRRAVTEQGNLRFTWSECAYRFAETIFVSINLDVEKSKDGHAQVDLSHFEAAIRTIGRNMRRDCLVVVESTVPPGTCTKIVEPALTEELNARHLKGTSSSPLLAHSYERVMPGPHYLQSIREFWRVFAGNSKTSADKTRAILSELIDTQRYPLHELPDMASSELAKVLENSYRATNIALIHEWTLFAESIGIDLFEVLSAIRKRKGTHDNIMSPGFGVGGYCLTKDALLADWAARRLFGLKSGLGMAVQSVRVNDRMPEHTFALIKRQLEDLKAKRIAILGLSYRSGVSDTRSSPTQTLVELVEQLEAVPLICDPLVRRWEERPTERIYGSPFEIEGPIDCIVFAVQHQDFTDLEPQDLVQHFGHPFALVDAQNIVGDAKVDEYQRLGCRVSAVGRGNIGLRQQGEHELQVPVDTTS